MCNCKELPNLVIDVEENWDSNKNEEMVALCSYFFKCIEAEEFEPKLSYSETNYKCLECGQRWYIECAPEECTYPEFAVKFNTVSPSKDEIRAHKQFLSILMSCGFASEKCRMKGCDNYKLKDMELCHVHGDKFWYI